MILHLRGITPLPMGYFSPFDGLRSVGYRRTASLSRLTLQPAGASKTCRLNQLLARTTRPVFVIGLVGILTAACASNGGQRRASDPSAPRDDAYFQCGAPPDEAQADEALPRYFTVELRASELSQGRITADGEAVPVKALPELLDAEAQNGAVRGAALVALPGVGADQVLRVFRQLSDAGFSHVLVSGMPRGDGSPRDAGPVASQFDGTSSKEGEEAALPEGGVPEDAAPQDVPSDVIVKNIGLHVGGGPNSAENKARYGDPIAERFEEFRRCHLMASDRSRNASFGVDLLVGAKGGRAKINDYRTSLKGKDFHLCVLGIFGDVKFPAPPRPTVISYSLLFKPQR